MNSKRNTLPQTKKSKNPYCLLYLMLFFPLSLFWCEIVTRISTYGDMSFKQIIYIMMFSFSLGGIISAVLSVIKNRKALRITFAALAVVLPILCISQIVYFNIFKNYYSWESAGMATEAVTDFFGQFISGIWKGKFGIILCLFPTALAIVFLKKLTSHSLKRVNMLLPLVMCAFASITFLIPSFILSANREFEGDLYYYNYPNDTQTYLNFGVLTGSRLNLGRIIFGEKEGGLPPISLDNGTTVNPDDIFSQGGSDTTGGNDTTSGTDDPTVPVEYGYNVLDIDFDTLIANEDNATIKAMHKYFQSLTPTKKNEYTGYFKGKNLIFLTLEGFSGKVINPELTPTLYKMSTQGFVFNNYYCSCWGGSTSTGEYANMTGNFYTSTTCMTKYAGTNYMPFTLGNQFKSIGYNTMAFHAHTYSYYNRDESHPNLGYDYVGIGNGLENLTDAFGNKISNGWPRSDLESAKVTIGQYIDKSPFHVYYMTISGHANYNWGGNNMCKRHRADIENYCQQYGKTYSEEVKAYLACQLEVELMLTELVNQLEEAGILDDTVFVMAADHYPYALTDAALSELYGLPVDGILKNFELYKNSLIIWSSSMTEPVTVDTPLSAIDILPTVSNLFGLEYDSRLMTGKDVFGDQEPIVVLNGVSGPYWCWINKYGQYNSSTGFTVNPNYEVDEDSLKSYVKSITSQVSLMKTYSFKILTEDYYAYVFGKK